MELAIGIDLGCTHIKAILVQADGTIVHEIRQDTDEQNDAHWKQSVKQIIQQLKQEARLPVTIIGLSAPGLANAANTCIEFMPGRLPGLENFNWSDYTGERIYVLNDAHAALMAEAQFGVAKNKKYAVMLTLGTGVGGGILIEGKLYQGVGQMAGHLGHVTVDAQDDKKDVTNMPGSLEDAIGNLSIEARSNGRFKTTWDLVEAYKAGDAFATQVWLASVRKLAAAIASFINILSPEVVIIGGGISKADEILMKPLQQHIAEFEWQPGGKQTSIQFAHFSDLAGALGAAGFALSKIK
ncbi:MAG: ROK family protein [Cyclobacteriaceae bacterium]|nr:ROK family protein [Cyclobacteriaceae bacterium]